ncbi:MAG: nitroreductase family protein [Deltaproteobacteria bacterium]|jgi:hypothetical protein|nr:nitroreductase family protein [Deltaproteobacteria bacterium]
MKRRTFIALGAGAAMAAALSLPEFGGGQTKFAWAAEATEPAGSAAPAVIGTRKPLPAPDKSGGVPLMQALAERQSNRSFNDAKLIDDQTLSNLLWATWGVNRPNGKHTAPTGRDRQKLAVYAALPDGIWFYNAKEHSLELVVAGDRREDLGDAPLVLLYSAGDSEWGPMEIGALYQNAGLFCASAGLSNVVKAQHLSDAREILPLPKGYSIIITQSVGWPG